MEVHLPAGCGVSGGVAGGDDGIQDAAGALGQGADPDGEENSAAGAAQRCAVPYQGGGVVSPDGEPELSADGDAFGAAAAGDDHPLLSGLVSDAVYRPAAVCGLDVFHLQLLSGLATRAFSQ